MSKRIAYLALAIPILIIFSRRDNGCTGAHSSIHNRIDVGDKQAYGRRNSTVFLGAECTLLQVFFVQMEHGTVNGEFGDVHGAVVVAPTPQFNGPKRSLIKIDILDTAFYDELWSKSNLVNFIHNLFGSFTCH